MSGSLDGWTRSEDPVALRTYRLPNEGPYPGFRASARRAAPSPLGRLLGLPERDGQTGPRSTRLCVVVRSGDERVRLLVDEILGDREGHQIEVAPNGRVALDRLRQRAYDVILSDLRMLELDGPGLYSEVERRAPELCRRFVFLTGDTLGEEVRAFLERTPAPSVSKPFAVEEVRRVVQQVLRTA